MCTVEKAIQEWASFMHLKYEKRQKRCGRCMLPAIYTYKPVTAWYCVYIILPSQRLCRWLSKKEQNDPHSTWQSSTTIYDKYDNGSAMFTKSQPALTSWTCTNRVWYFRRDDSFCCNCSFSDSIKFWANATASFSREETGFSPTATSFTCPVRRIRSSVSIFMEWKEEQRKGSR